MQKKQWWNALITHHQHHLQSHELQTVQEWGHCNGVLTDSLIALNSLSYYDFPFSFSNQKFDIYQFSLDKHVALRDNVLVNTPIIFCRIKKFEDNK